MQDKLCFVQFMHTGGEHRPAADGRMQWNDGAHRRKFLACDDASRTAR